VTGSVVKIADDLGVKAIIALTKTGYTARMISRHKPESTIISVTYDVATYHQLNISFGCLPVLINEYTEISVAFKNLREYCLKNKILSKGDKVVIVACSSPEKKDISANAIIVETI